MRRLFYPFLIFLLLSQALALTPEERAYFDAQNQKTVAQISSKIEGVEKNTQENMQREFHDSTVFVEKSITTRLNRGLKAIGFMVAGFVIGSLAIFKLFDLRFSTTKGIKKYEQQLEQQISLTKQYLKDLEQYKQEMVLYFNRYSQITDYQMPSVKVIKPPIAPVSDKKFKLNAKFLFYIVLILLILSLLYIGYTMFTETIQPLEAQNNGTQ